MKTYHVREKTKKLYMATGIFYSIIAALVVIVKPWHYRNPILDLLVYAFVFLLAAGNLFRGKTCQLTMDASELQFYNGLLDKKSVLLNRVERVEWKPGAYMRFYYKGARRYAAQIPDLFSEQDTEEIIKKVKRKKIQVIRMDLLAEEICQKKGTVVNE